VTVCGDIRDANIAALSATLQHSKVATLLGSLDKQNSGNLPSHSGFHGAEPFSGLDLLAEAHHDDRDPEKY
jgi:hypothetical protein